MSDKNRVVAYFDHKGKPREVKGIIVQSLTQRGSQQPNFYELHTDEQVDFFTRDLEVHVKATRTTNQANSLFVCADQCAPDSSFPPPNPPNQKQIEPQKPPNTTTQFKTGDPVTFPLEEAPNGLINGVVGYTGSHNTNEVTELCADPDTITSAFISKIRWKYEFPNFPEGKRICHMKGFSLVVLTHQLIPGAHIDASQKGVNGAVINTRKNFSQVVCSNNSRKTSSARSSNYPSQNKEFGAFKFGDVSEERQDDFIISLNYNDQIIVLTDYGLLYGLYRQTLDIDRELHVAIELFEIPPGSPADWKTPDGVLHDKRLFDCRPGHGALVHISKCRVSSSVMHGAAGTGEVTVSDESTLQGLPNLFHNSHITITEPHEFFPPLDSLRAIVGDNKGIQGHMNSCYMDSSLFGMFAFSSIFDPLFLKQNATVSTMSLETPSIQRYNHVRSVLQTRIVFPLRKSQFVRADQIMMLRRELNNAGIIDGLMRNEKDPEEFLKVLLQHVLNAEPFLKLKRESEEVNAEYIYQIFSAKQANVTLPTVQFLLEHSFKEHKIILDSAPHVLLLQMPRCGKHFKMYPRIFPSLQLSLDNLTSTTYGPKCIVCLGDATFRCPNCEDIKLYYYTNVFVYYCNECVRTVHIRRQEHKPVKLLLMKGAANLPPAKMELFAILTIETSHYVCFSRCKHTWVMFDSMADREGQQFGRNIPRVTELPDLEEWLSSPEKLLDWMATDRTKSYPIPKYVDRITRDTYLCMYHSEQVSMF